MATIITTLTPTSPIHGIVEPGASDGSHCPFIQFLNGASSGVNAIVYEIRIGATRPSTAQQIRVKRTSSPAAAAGTGVVTGSLTRRDETDTTAIQCTLKGYPNNKAAADLYPATTDSFWFGHITSDGTNPYSEVPLLVPLSFPIVVKPGSALEFGDPSTNTNTQRLRVFLVFDEKAV